MIMLAVGRKLDSRRAIRIHGRMSHEQLIQLSPSSCRAARELLKMSVDELASLAGVSVSTVRRLERGERPVSDYALRSVLNALHGSGVRFVGVGSRPELK
jgi:DNA-binding transcriptional regulator YiaG